MIRKIKIENFRSIKKQAINNISDKMALIGENSSGKSAILSSLLIVYGEIPIKESDFRVDERKGRMPEIQIGVSASLDRYVSIRLLKYYSKRVKPQWYKNVEKKCERKRTSAQPSENYLTELRIALKKELGINTNSFNFVVKYTIKNGIKKDLFIADNNFKPIGTSNLTLEEKEELIGCVLPPFAYLKDEREFANESQGNLDSVTNRLFSLMQQNLQFQQISEAETIEATPIGELDIGEIHSYLLEKLKNEAQDIVQSINKNFAESYKQNVRVNWEFENQLFETVNIQTSFSLNDSQNNIAFNSVGSGTRSIYKLVLLQTLAERQSDDNPPVLFLLEEPELYLYPKLERNMASFINKLATKNQVILTTHSNVVIREFNSTDVKIVKMDKPDSQFPVTSVAPIKGAEEVFDMLGYDISYFIKEKYIIFVEGKDDLKNYTKVFKSYFGESFESINVCLAGVTNLATALNLKVLNQIGKNLDCVYIIDSDGRDKSEAIQATKRGARNNECKELLQYQDKIIVTEYCMLECYTMDADLYNPKHYLKAQESFMNDNIQDINKLMKERGVEPIQTSKNPEKIRENFEIVRKRGLNKKLVNLFDEYMNRSGCGHLKEANQLTDEQISKCYKSLLDDIQNRFGITKKQ